MRRVLLLFVALALYASAVPQAIVTTPKGYALQFAEPPSLNPADATTYFFGGQPSLAAVTTADVARITIPRAGTVRRIDLSARILGVAGTTETSTISFRLNNTTDTTITATLNMSASVNVSATVSITVAAGDYFEIKWLTPTWVTNPTTVGFFGVVYVDVP